MSKKIHWSLLLNLVGIIILIVVLIRIDIVKTFRILLGSDRFFFSMALLLTLITNFIRSWRWNYLMRLQKIKYSLTKSFIMFMGGLYMGLVTPGRIGEFFRAFYLKKDGLSFGKSFLSIILDRVIDFGVLFIFGYLSLFIFKEFFKKQIMFISILLGAVLIIVVLIAFNKSIIKKIIRLLFNLYFPKKYREKFKFNFYDMYADLKSLNIKEIIYLTIWTILLWVMYYVVGYLLSLSLGINVPFLYIIAFITLTSFVTLIPLSISGIGTREASMIFLFSIIDIEKEKAVAFSLSIFLMSVFSAIIGFFCWMNLSNKYPHNKRRR